MSFDHLNIDSRRDKQMIAAEDWIHGQPLNLKEARRMTDRDSRRRGGTQVRLLGDALSHAGLGLDEHEEGRWRLLRRSQSWSTLMDLQPKVELTGHIDLKDTLPADPTLLFIWHGSHYGGVPIFIAEDERWNKVVGPFLIYCDSGPTPDAMWKDALARSAEERKQWPYAWVKDPGYAPPAQRGGVSGRLVVKDPQDSKANASNAWVGLAQAPYTESNGSGQAAHHQLGARW